MTDTTAGRDTLDAEWELGADGVRHRRAARVILVDGLGRLLLMHGFDVADPAISWWFTVGGGIAAGEDERAAAVREVREETGLDVSPSNLVGPVVVRHPSFPYFGQICRQHETIFYVRVDGEVEVSDGGWTDVERASVDRWRWWTPAELAATEETVHPMGLAEIAEMLMTDGWDGVTRTID